MTPQTITAIIASATSIAIAVFSYVQGKINQRRLQQEFEKSQKRTLTSKLIDLRIEYYARAFEITGVLRKIEGNNYDPKKVKETLHELNKWSNGTVNMIISYEAETILNEFIEILRRKPGQEVSFTETQVKNIWNHRYKFRQILKKDIGILHKEDENYKNR